MCNTYFHISTIIIASILRVVSAPGRVGGGWGRVLVPVDHVLVKLGSGVEETRVEVGLHGLEVVLHVDHVDNGAHAFATDFVAGDKLFLLLLEVDAQNVRQLLGNGHGPVLALYLRPNKLEG